jgi:outer membrane lipoprotein SlyB
MASTTFSGPVNSAGGFVGPVTGNVTGDVTGTVTGNVTGNVTGYIILPTADPEVVGALWNDDGTITISAG